MVIVELYLIEISLYQTSANAIAARNNFTHPEITVSPLDTTNEKLLKL